MHTQIISRVEDLASIQEDWRSLFLEREDLDVSQSPEWTLNWLKYFDQDCKLNIILVYEGNQLIAVIPLLIRHYRGIRSLQFIGSEESDYNDFLIHKDWTDPAQLAITKALTESQQDWDIFEVLEAQPGSLINAIVTPNWLPNTQIIHLQETPCPKIKLPSSWEAYLNTLNAKNQRNHRRKLRRLTEDYGLNLNFFYDPEDISLRIRDLLLFRLDAWKKADRIGELPPLHLEKEYISFLSEFCTAAARYGRVCLAEISVENTAISYILGFSSQSRIFLYSRAYDSRYNRYGPGAILDFLFIKHAIEKGFDIFDFGRGDEAYKFKTGAILMNNNNYLVVREGFNAQISDYLTDRQFKQKDAQESYKTV